MKIGDVPSGEEFWATGKQFFRRNPDGFQGKIAPSSGQKARRLSMLTFFKQALILAYYYMHTPEKLSRNLRGFELCKQKGSVRIIYRFTLQIGRFLGGALPPFNGNDNICFLLHYLYIIRKESAAHGTLLLVFCIIL